MTDLAPAKTPAAIINPLREEIVRTRNRADVKELFLNSGAEVVGSSPEEFAATIKSDMDRANVMREVDAWQRQRNADRRGIVDVHAPRR